MTERKVTGVLQSDWSAAIQDYPIASGWTHDGGALVVCDSAGGVYALTLSRVNCCGPSKARMRAVLWQ